MSIISFISFFICAVIIITAFKKNLDFFSPARIFTVLWLIVIGLCDLKFSRLQHEWDSFGWIMLLLGIVSFLAGTFVVYVINYSQNILPIISVRDYFAKDLVDKNKFLKTIIILFIVYCLSYFGNYLIEGFVPMFAYDPGKSRTLWGVFGIGLIVHASASIILLCTQYIILTKPKFLVKSFIIGLVLITFITYLFLLQRFNLMFAIIAVVVFIYYSSNILRFRNSLLIFLAIIVLMYSVQYFRMSSFAVSYLYKMAKMKFSPEYAIFTEPYMYVVMNIENFTRAVGRLETNTFGIYTFNFILSLSGSKHILEEYINLKNYVFLNSSYNTYSMFWDYYRDFGTIGLSLIPFCLGFSISTIYYQMRKSPTLTSVSIYSVAVFIIVISFFMNVIGLLHFVFNVTVIVTLTKYVQKFSPIYDRTH